MTPTFEQRLEKLEHVVFGNGDSRTTPIDPAAEKVADSCKIEVARYFNVPVAWMRIRNRTKRVAFIRQIAMALSWELSGLPSQSVADAFNRKDHNTVRHAGRVIARWAKRRDNYQVLQELRRRVVNSTRE